MRNETKDKIIGHLSDVMERLITRRCDTEPFNEELILTHNPFGARLIPMEVWKGSKFERSFVTTLGQGIFEVIGKYIAEGSGAYAENQHLTNLHVCTWRIERIDTLLSNQRSGSSAPTPNWTQEVSEMLTLSNDRFIDVPIISDLYVIRPGGIEEFCSFKTVKPNLDQTEKAKRDMLRLLAGDNNYQPFFALPYNPAGDGETYKRCGFTFPYKLFDMDNDECVLVGSKLWNKLGDEENAYEDLLNLFDEVGRKYIPIIKTRYLNI